MKNTMFTTPAVFLCITGFFCGFAAQGWADGDPNEPYANSTSEQIVQGMPAAASSPTLPFDPNDYNLMIYDCQGGENSIHAAMQKIGITTYTTCNATNPVTLSGLNNHDILIVGWDSSGGDKSGLVTSAIEQGITGRVILSGHDSDYHTVNVEAEDAATTFFIQEIEYVLNGAGTGLVVCADPVNNFSWLPEFWGVTANNTGGSEISTITQDGLDSGVYDNLTKELMSNWSTSFHNTFTAWGDGFKVFELGHSDQYTVTIAAPINPRGFIFVKEDDVPDGEERCPDDEFNYTICYDNITEQIISNAFIYDYLPVGVDIISADPEGIYDPNTHTYIWDIGTIPVNDANCVTLTVKVNEKSEPGVALHNIAELFSGDTLLARDTEDTPVCCWDNNSIIYVDHTATGNNNGTSWIDAYTDLQNALYRATYSDCIPKPDTIYVAQGTYLPGENADDSFVLPDGCKVYGGFPSGGCAFNKRNPKKYETILSGLVDDDAFPDIDTIVTVGNECVLDGFVITGAAFFGHAVYGNGVDFEVAHSVIKENYGYGIYAENGNVDVKKCTINQNDRDGIRHKGFGHVLTVENSWLLRNGESGILSENSTPSIRNSIVSESSLVEDARAGVRMVNPAGQPILQNCTISNNRAEGIQYVNDTDPNYLQKSDYLDIRSCIIYYNNSSAEQVKGLNPDKVANYCCIADCNEIPGVTTNYNDVPGFAYAIDPNGTPDPNNYHLASDAFCLDKGDPMLMTSALPDYDGEIRVMGDFVDIGADEVNPDCGEVGNEFDWNADGVVNFNELGSFQRAWLSYDPNHPLCDPNNPDFVSDPNAPGYISESDKQRFNKQCDLVADLTIDLLDIETFVSDAPWLWSACWRTISDCPDSYNVLDYDHDGLVNMVEYSLFAKYWQTYQPGNPDWQFCNLDATGGSQYTIDLADLMIFMDDWLWVSCARVDEFPAPVPPAAAPPVAEPTALEQALELNENICVMADLWENDPNLQQEIDPNEWQDFMDVLCIELDTLIGSFDDTELMAYNLIAGPSCCGGEMMMSGGGETISAMGEETLLMSTTEITTTELTAVEPKTALIAASPESEIKKLPLDTQIELAQKYVALDQMSVFLEKLWLEEPTLQKDIDTETWQEFMDSVYGELQDMQLLFE